MMQRLIWRQVTGEESAKESSRPLAPPRAAMEHVDVRTCWPLGTCAGVVLPVLS